MKIFCRIGALLLTGCAGQLPLPGPQACDIHKAAEIPIAFERGFVSAPALIDDQPVILLFDTGSEVSLVTPIAMTELRLQQDPHRRTTILGVGGTITAQNAFLPSIGIGGMEMLNQSVGVGTLPVLQNAAMNASGLLGADWLRSFDVEIDLPHLRVALFRVADCSGDYIPWQGPKTSVAAQIYRAGLVLLPAKLDGKSVIVLLDSGANRSSLSEAAAGRIGVDASALALDRSGKSTGIDGATIATRGHRFATFQIGSVTYARPVISVSPLHIGIADMLLGADWLRANRVWISYAARRVTFQKAAPNGYEPITLNSGATQQIN